MQLDVISAAVPTYQFLASKPSYIETRLATNVFKALSHASCAELTVLAEKVVHGLTSYRVRPSQAGIA